MKLPYTWLKELSGVDWSVEEMAERLLRSGTAGVAERIDSEHFANVVVGEIRDLKRHPNADKLLVAEVESGSGTQTVICGAPNCAVGQKVALALPGACLRGEFEIKEITMRGVKSAGMICAEDELGLSDDHSGIIVLDPDAPLGKPVYEYLGLDETVFNFEITPNRPDCLSVIGVAREISVLADKEFRVLFDVPRESERKAGDYIAVRINDPDACPRYAARMIDNITIGPSPQWMRKRLMDCGMRSINNIVDITNYVMLETGHPLHAFDYDRFGSKEVVVRRAKKKEKFISLDEQEHTLDETVLLVTNGKAGVAAAGVMGGLDSEVTGGTRTILLEAAYFDPAVIRRSSRKLGISSESSYRFERGVDPNGVVHAADRAAALMAELAGGEVLSGVVDTYAKKISPVTIELRPPQVKRLLGVDISRESMEKTLRGLGLELESGESIVAKAPTYRPDLTREVDLIEEIARIHGLDNIPNATRNAGPLFTPTHRRNTIQEDMRRVLTGLGFDETLGSGMAHRKRLENIDGTLAPVEIINPLSDEFMVMRTRMLYSLLLSTGNNIRHRNIDLRIFEIGKVYRRGKSRPDEPLVVGFLMCGRPDGLFWRRGPDATDFFDIKGVVETVVEGIGLSDISLDPKDIPGYVHNIAYRVTVDGKEIGSVGMVDAKAARQFDIKQDCFAAELNCDAILQLPRSLAEFTPLAKYPASSRDIAVIVDGNIPATRIEAVIGDVGGELVESVTLFDLFTGGAVPKGKKSVAYAIRYRSADKTLEDEEVDRVHDRIVGELEKQFKARLRE